MMGNITFGGEDEAIVTGVRETNATADLLGVDRMDMTDALIHSEIGIMGKVCNRSMIQHPSTLTHSTRWLCSSYQAPQASPSALT